MPLNFLKLLEIYIHARFSSYYHWYVVNEELLDNELQCINCILQANTLYFLIYFCVYSCCWIKYF